MIHRDHRQGYESASAFGQIIHREGPADMAFGDIDGYCEARVQPAPYEPSQYLLRLLEHKQPDQPIGGAQKLVLHHLDECLRNAPADLRLHPDSGVYIIKGQLDVAEESRRNKVDFRGPQTVYRPDGSIALQPKTRTELYDWIRGRPGWKPRNGAGRREWLSP